MKYLSIEIFKKRFEEILLDLGTTWESVGFLDKSDDVYPFGTDTKVISTVFESYVAPIINTIAQEFYYRIEGADQTIYPDFTLNPPEILNNRIAIDVKTTYRDLNINGEIKKFKYTLGSYTSFLRDPQSKKNIKYPYNEYSDHWVIGFLYTRVYGIPSKVYKRKDIFDLICPYKDVEYFIQEKYKIVGESPGSGNTTNIGSYPTNNIDDLRNGKGPFARLGKEICDDYWRNYDPKATGRKYSNISEYLSWRDQQ